MKGKLKIDEKTMADTVWLGKKMTENDSQTRFRCNREKNIKWISVYSSKLKRNRVQTGSEIITF